MPTPEPKPPYQLITGPHDAAFGDRVSDALADGYRLHGSPCLAFNGAGRLIAAQAVVLDIAVDKSGALR